MPSASTAPSATALPSPSPSLSSPSPATLKLRRILTSPTVAKSPCASSTPAMTPAASPSPPMPTPTRGRAVRARRRRGPTHWADPTRKAPYLNIATIGKPRTRRIVDAVHGYGFPCRKTRNSRRRSSTPARRGSVRSPPPSARARLESRSAPHRPKSARPWPLAPREPVHDPPKSSRSPRNTARHWPSKPSTGWRSRSESGAPAGRRARGVRIRHARGRAGVRQRRPLHRTIPRPPAPRRSADPRRRRATLRPSARATARRSAAIETHRRGTSAVPTPETTRALEDAAVAICSVRTTKAPEPLSFWSIRTARCRSWKPTRVFRSNTPSQKRWPGVDLVAAQLAIAEGAHVTDIPG